MGLVGMRLDGNGTPTKTVCLEKDSGDGCKISEKVPQTLELNDDGTEAP